MALVTITRGKGAPVMIREQVPNGAVFSVRQPDGRNGARRYAALGMNGRMYGFNIDTQELASSASNDKKCALIGSWEFKLDRTYRPGVGREVKRSAVTPGQLFRHVNGGPSEYIHVGRVTKDKKGWLSIPVDRQENHAIAQNGESVVVVVGHAEIAVTLSV